MTWTKNELWSLDSKIVFFFKTNIPAIAFKMPWEQFQICVVTLGKMCFISSLRRGVTFGLLRVTRCIICSLLVEEVACCKKSLVTNFKVRSLLVAEVESV